MKTIVLKPDLARAVETIINDPKTSGYAKTYAKAINDAIALGESLGETKRAVQIQLQYIVSNLSSWRGQTARDTKLVLKSYYSKEPFVPSNDPHLN